MVSIDLTPGRSTTQVLAKLLAPAIVAEVPMKSPDELTSVFDIKNEDMKRFLETLNDRGMVGLNLSFTYSTKDSDKLARVPAFREFSA